MKIRLLFLLLLVHGNQIMVAQPFMKNQQKKPITFKEMQLQYKAWTDTVNVSEAKHWKYFKRWEMEMQLHTASNGEPENAEDYLHALINSSEEKQKLLIEKNPASYWYPVGPDLVPSNLTGYMENGIGRINCIAFHPSNTSTFFVGVAQGGLWKTTNNGQSWTPLTDDLPIIRISDIAINPVDPGIMYISVCDFEYVGIGLYLDGRKRNTHYGLGLYKTTDGGLNWQPTGLSFQLTDGDASLIRKVLIHPDRPDTLVACGVSGMYNSFDAGNTWIKKLDTLCWDLVQDPVNPEILYAASGWVQNANDGYAGIFKSTDFGNSWILLNTDIPPVDSVQRIKIAISPSDPDYIYAVAVNTDNGLFGIYKSTDAGLSWEFIYPGINILDAFQGSSIGGQGTYDLAVLVNATNKNTVYVGGVNLWGSVDGCQSFNPVSHWTFEYGPTVHGDIHSLERQPLTGNIFVCSDGGVYRTTQMLIGNWYDANNGVPWPTQWTNLSDGLAITSFYRISSSKNSDGRIAAGSQDNATVYFDGTSWKTVFGGDGMDNFLDPQNDNFILGSSQYGNFYISDDDGYNWWGISANVNSEVSEWTSPLAADYNQPGTFYTGFANVCKSDDGGYTWNSISNFPTGFNNNEISAIAVSSGNSNILYVAKRVRYEYGIPGSLFKTTDGGITWTDKTAGLPDSLYFTSVEVSGADENTVYVTMAGMGAGNKVFKSSDGGNSWQNISYSLPNIPVNCVKNIPGTEDILIATDIGVYVLYKDSLNWINYSTGLPNVIVSDIEFNLALNKMYICTFGRGIWASDLQTVSIAEKDKWPGPELFPSLNNGTFTLLNSGNNPLHLQVIDIKGRIVASQNLTGKVSYSISLDLKPGLYFALISKGDLQVVKKFIVE